MFKSGLQSQIPVFRRGILPFVYGILLFQLRLRTALIQCKNLFIPHLFIYLLVTRKWFETDVLGVPIGPIFEGHAWTA